MDTASVTDFTQFAALRRGANNDDPQVLREVAGQFEALFVQTMMKNMREAKLAEPIFGSSDQHDMYQDMLDRQYALEMTKGRGIGLADMLVLQLGGGSRTGSTEKAMYNDMNAAQAAPLWKRPEEFARDIWPHAEKAARKLRVSAEGLVAQAALETGWGRHVMRRIDGAPSYNLFGIKAGSNWAGPTASKRTLEFRDGVSAHELARFRAYPNLEETFDDYVRVIGTQPRYDNVRNNGEDTTAFARALQASGYATDPHYAEKIERILDGDTMRKALAGIKSASVQPITDPHVAAGAMTAAR